MNNYNEISQKSLEELTPTQRGLLAQKAVQDAIARMHSSGIATVEVDEAGKLYHRHPDGRLTPIERSE